MTWYPDSTIIFSGAVAFDKVEVVSLRKEKNFLSYSKSGWNGYGILMADTIHLALASHLDHAFHKAKKSEGKLLIILHDFSVQGLKGLPRLGAAHLRAEIFVGTDDNYYLVNAFDEYQEVDNGKNAFLSINSAANMVFERLVNAIKTDSTKAKSPMF